MIVGISERADIRSIIASMGTSGESLSWHLASVVVVIVDGVGMLLPPEVGAPGLYLWVGPPVDPLPLPLVLWDSPFH